MKILIKTLSNGIGHQIIDAWHAYVQHTNNYENDTEYILNGSTDASMKVECDLRILCDYMGNQITDVMLKQYDIVLICNGGEPIAAASPRLKHLLTHDNVYLIANSYLMAHELQSKIVWFPHNVMTCRDYWTRHFYPQYYDIVKFEKLQRNNNIAVIGGASRANRAHFFSMLHSVIPELVDQSSFNGGMQAVFDSQWETNEDKAYKIYVNNLYPQRKIDPQESQNQYYNKSITVGVGDKFGSIPPGYFHLPLYYENSCVVFPESSWQNNELCITEKSLKCFYAKSLPFPISGANVNQLYNQVGFYTAWNLLPDELKVFDSIADHEVRQQGSINAIRWLHNNSEVFNSLKFIEYTQQNKERFLACSCDSIAVQNFDNVMRKYLKQAGW
jgi:hypothetical protein